MDHVLNIAIPQKIQLITEALLCSDNSQHAEVYAYM